MNLATDREKERPRREREREREGGRDILYAEDGRKEGARGIEVT